MASLVDRMEQVPDAASVAAMRWTTERLGRSVGGSTGTNMWAALQLVGELVARGDQGSVVTLICDGGARYAGTYYDDAWVASRGWPLEPYRATLDEFALSARWSPPTALDERAEAVAPRRQNQPSHGESDSTAAETPRRG